MYYVFLVLIIIVAVLLLLIVLVQKSKGGGLASEFSSANQYAGVAETNKKIEKATWIMAVTIVVFSIAASLTIPHAQKTENKSIVQEQVNNNADYSNIPTLPQQNQVKTQTQNNNQGTTEKKDNSGN